MWTLVWFLVHLTHVFGLRCFVSDFGSFKVGNFKHVGYSLKDCNQYNEMVEGFSDELQFSGNSSLNCYFVGANSDIAMMGCVKKGGCYFLIDKIQQLLDVDHKNISGKMECTECNTNKCNAPSMQYFETQTTALTPPQEWRAPTSRKCHFCLEPCTVDNSQTKICGQHIGKSFDAVCTTEISRDSENPDFAVRKCQVVPKEGEPKCPQNSVCTLCKSDMCNVKSGWSSEAALKCYYCLEGCEVSKATEKTCGQNIGPSQEAVCTKEIPAGKDAKMAIRKCQIVNKGQDAVCPDNSKCTSCKSELCNAAPSLYGNMGVMGALVAALVGRYLWL